MNKLLRAPLALLIAFAAMLGAATMASAAEPPSGRDGVKMIGHCGTGGGLVAYYTATLNNYQRNSGTTTADNTASLVALHIESEARLNTFTGNGPINTRAQAYSASGNAIGNPVASFTESHPAGQVWQYEAQQATRNGANQIDIAIYRYGESVGCTLQTLYVGNAQV